MFGYKKGLGPDHPSALDVVGNLGNLFRDQGRLEKAETMDQQAPASKESVLGQYHQSQRDNYTSTVYFLKVKWVSQPVGPY